MTTVSQLFEHNRAWAAGIRAASPDFFARLAVQQDPDFLWIGCSDSRVPANEIIGLRPGELFVHRNVANQVMSSDKNSLSVLAYAVDALKVEHVIVCGHYGCGGIQAAAEDSAEGVVREWLSPVRQLYERNRVDLEGMTDDAERMRALCRLNVVDQVIHVGATETLQKAWQAGSTLTVHGWIYDLEDGELVDLQVSVSSLEEHGKLQPRL